MESIKNLSTKKVILGSTIIILLLIILLYSYQQNNITKNETISSQEKISQPGTFTDEDYKSMGYVVENKEGWTTYKNDDLKFEFKYPPILQIGVEVFKPEWENSPVQGPAKEGFSINFCLPPYGCQDSIFKIKVVKNISEDFNVESYLNFIKNDVGSGKDSTFLNYPSKTYNGITTVEKDNNLYIFPTPDFKPSSTSPIYESIINKSITGILSSFKFLE